MLEVKEADYVGNYRIHLVFNDGRNGVANLEQAVFNDDRPVFSKLREKENFKDFKVEHSTLVWSDELDLAAEYLFYITFMDDPDLQEQFKRWGYIV